MPGYGRRWAVRPACSQGRVPSSRGALRSLATAGALLVVIDGLVGRSRLRRASRSQPRGRSGRRSSCRAFRFIVEGRRPWRVDVSGAGSLRRGPVSQGENRVAIRGASPHNGGRLSPLPWQALSVPTSRSTGAADTAVSPGNVPRRPPGYLGRSST